MSQRYTHIVVGAGAAGCAVAARLSEEPANRVLLLEAGGPDRNPLIHMPAGFTKLTGPDVNWGFETVPQPELNGRRMHYPQGRTLGGSTSINAMDGFPEMSFGGYGASGIGRELGRTAIDEYIEHKSTIIRTGIQAPSWIGGVGEK